MKPAHEETLDYQRGFADALECMLAEIRRYGDKASEEVAYPIYTAFDRAVQSDAAETAHDAVEKCAIDQAIVSVAVLSAVGMAASEYEDVLPDAYVGPLLRVRAAIGGNDELIDEICARHKQRWAELYGLRI